MIDTKELTVGLTSMEHDETSPAGKHSRGHMCVDIFYHHVFIFNQKQKIFKFIVVWYENIRKYKIYIFDGRYVAVK